MKTHEIDAIKMPKEASGLPEDTYLLLILGSGATQAFLPHGRRYSYRHWSSPAFETGKVFITKKEYWAILENSKYIATHTDYKNEGSLSLNRYKEIIEEAFDSAKTIEEIGEITLVGGFTCKTSRDLYVMCVDFHEHGRLDFKRGELDINDDYLDYVTQPFYVIKLSDGTYLGQHPGERKTTLGIHKAFQSATENEALERADEYLKIVGKAGYEIIKIDGADRDEALACLKKSC